MHLKILWQPLSTLVEISKIYGKKFTRNNANQGCLKLMGYKYLRENGY